MMSKDPPTYTNQTWFICDGIADTRMQEGRWGTKDNIRSGDSCVAPTKCCAVTCYVAVEW